MRWESLCWAGCSSVMALAYWWVMTFAETQEHHFNQILAEQQSFQSDIKTLEKDLAFLKENQSIIDFLEKKGWFLPKSRLIAGEWIEKSQSSLNSVEFIFEPEANKNIEEKYNYRVSSIIIKVKSILDTDIYSFVQNLLETFPGILVPREFVLIREEKINKNDLLSLRQKSRPHFVEGKLVFDWFSMGRDVDEK